MFWQGVYIKDEIFAANPSTEGAMYCPIILGSNKTTVSVVTGHVQYHPMYLSIRNPHNTLWHAHRNTIAFLTISKCVYSSNSWNPCLIMLFRWLLWWQLPAFLWFPTAAVSCIFGGCSLVGCHHVPLALTALTLALDVWHIALTWNTMLSHVPQITWEHSWKSLTLIDCGMSMESMRLLL